MSRVAILGAGIMGTATALFMARRGVRVTLFDQAPAPMAGASRWNEGKIHLGYLYAADRTLDTARLVIPGGLAFRPLVEELLGESIAPAIGGQTDIYAIHRASVVTPEAAAAYYAAVATAVDAAGPAATYLDGAAIDRPRRLSTADLERLYDPATIVAAFQVPERSVETTWIADRLVEVLAAEPRITLRMGVRVTGVRARGGHDSLDGPLDIDTTDHSDGPFDAVVNALWDGRLAVDATAGVAPPARWSHRYRLALFLTVAEPVAIASTVVATGPFGDVKNYDGRRLYLSWYPDGLRAEGHELAPPVVPSLDATGQRALAAAIVQRLATIVPAVSTVAPLAERATVAGGWVYAAGQGSLSDPRATLHQRAGAGIRGRGRYLSVDTGKYSIAPWLARQVANALL
jgi:glycine/D-amino acid oxidase-like deaminating enzyme